MKWFLFQPVIEKSLTSCERIGEFYNFRSLAYYCCQHTDLFSDKLGVYAEAYAKNIDNVFRYRKMVLCMNGRIGWQAVDFELKPIGKINTMYYRYGVVKRW